jgi:NAD(P)-dependent dehydrogenase (short-subunit alcohol dehydrogenase family)
LGRKVALITGGASNLGKDLTTEIASLGFDIILNFYSTNKKSVNDFKESLEEGGIKVYPIKADISKIKEIRMMFDFIKKKVKRLDLLINNAAIFEHKDFFNIDEKFFNKTIDTNLKSIFFCSQLAAKLMLLNKTPGKIINIASLGAFENWTGYIPYSISKAGVIKLTQLLAKKLAPRIIVNSISPGIIDIKGKKDKNVNKKFLKNYPMKRFSSSADIISLVRYLIIENNYITGQNFIVDGGKKLN